jgi:hypothetical protein
MKSSRLSLVRCAFIALLVCSTQTLLNAETRDIGALHNKAFGEYHYNIADTPLLTTTMSAPLRTVLADTTKDYYTTRQDSLRRVGKRSSRSWQNYNGSNWNFNDWDDFEDWTFGLFTDSYRNGDFRVSLEAGVGTPMFSVLNGDINPTQQYGIRFGFERNYTQSSSSNFVFQGETGFFISTQRTPSPSTDRALATGVQFGTFETEGLGYSLGGNSSLVFFNGNGSAWTIFDKISAPESTITTFDPDGVLASYGSGSLRFGKTYTNGIALNLGDISLTGSFDNTLVYRRHLVLQWYLSESVETISNYFVNSLARRVFRAQPDISPVVAWVMQTALNYGWYRMRSTQMTFPFNSEAALRYDAFVVRMTVRL